MKLRSLLPAVVLALFAAGSPCATSAPAALPGDSVYQREAQLTDDRGQRFAWSEKRGRPRLVSMFYTSCTFTCPLIIDAGKAIEDGLSARERADFSMMLISFDPDRDTPQALARMRKERGLDATRWTLARPDPKDVRPIAALLGVRYRKLADGDFNHTSALLLLDADGRIVARTERLAGPPDPAFVAAVHRVLRASPPRADRPG